MLQEATIELLAKLPVALLVIEPPGIIRWANPRALALVGLTLAQVKDKLVFDLVHPEDRAIVAERVGALLDQEALPIGRYRILRDSGLLVTIEVDSVTTTIDGASYVVTALREAAPGPSRVDASGREG
jgi:PAS domain S-box-containing protein